MNNSVRPTDDINNIENVITTHGNMLFKICLVILCKEQDAEDALQDTFIKYMLKAPTFSDSEHQKAWLIRVATNTCKDMRRFKLRHPTIDIDELSNYCTSEEDTDILEMVLRLPEKYKLVIHLHYIEGYDITNISEILNISVSAVKKRLQRGREKLKIEYGKELLLNG